MKLTKKFSSPPQDHYFFGYYDKSPLNAGNTRLLAQRTSMIDRMPKKGDVIEIGYFDFPDGKEFHHVTHTTSWNWQQGCMLQWLGPDFDREIIFNDIRNGQYVSVLLDIESGAEKVLPMPVYTITSDGKWGFCVDYERLYWLRPGYNYQGEPNPKKNTPVGDDDGIWKMSLETGEVSKIISTQEVLNTSHISAMDGGAHYLEHIMVNQSNERFCFLHRWRAADGGIFTRLFSANLDGSQLRLVNDSGRISHLCWRNDTTIFGYAGIKTMVNRLRQYKSITKYLIKPLLPIYHALVPDGTRVSASVTGDAYLLCDDTGMGCEQIKMARTLANGHPSFRPGSDDIFVNDTYPEANGDCQFYLYDLGNDRMLYETVIETNPALRQTGHRCDLHPKWSLDGLYVSIDVATEDGRRIDVYEVEE